MLAALATLQQALQRPHVSAQDAKQHREDFRKHMAQDSADVVNKILATLGKDIGGVLEEVIDQTHQFWTNQLNRLEEAHRAATAELQHQLLVAHEKHEETVKMYTQVIDNLNSQLSDTHNKLESERQSVLGLQTQLSSVEHTLEQTSKTYKGVIQEMNRQLVTAQNAQREEEVKGRHQQNTVSKEREQHQKELEDITSELKKVTEKLVESEARNKKLTAVSQHLLAKHQQLKAAATTSAAGATEHLLADLSTPSSRSVGKQEDSCGVGLTAGFSEGTTQRVTAAELPGHSTVPPSTEHGVQEPSHSGGGDAATCSAPSELGEVRREEAHGQPNASIMEPSEASASCSSVPATAVEGPSPS